MQGSPLEQDTEAHALGTSGLGVCPDTNPPKQGRVGRAPALLGQACARSVPGQLAAKPGVPRTADSSEKLSASKCAVSTKNSLEEHTERAPQLRWPVHTHGHPECQRRRRLSRVLRKPRRIKEETLDQTEQQGQGSESEKSVNHQVSPNNKREKTAFPKTQKQTSIEPPPGGTGPANLQLEAATAEK